MFCILVQEVILHILQEPLGLLTLCCIVFSADIREVEAPHENKAIVRLPTVPKEYIIYVSILVGWAITDSHQVICLLGLPPDSYSNT